MRPRTTLALLIAAALAAAVILFWESRLPGTDARREQAARLVPRLGVEEVDRIEIDREGGRLVLAKQDESWRLLEPVEDLADGWEVEALLRELIEAKVRGRIPAGEVRGGDEETGLGAGAPHALLFSGERRVGFRVGTRPAPGGARYARLDGSDQLAIVGAPVAAALERSAADLRERSLFPFSTLDVKRLEIERGGRRLYVLERRSGDRWWLAEPIEDEADQSEAARVVGAVVGLRAERFLDAPAGDLGFDDPAFRVVIGRGPDEDPTKLELGRTTETGPMNRYGRVTGRPAPFELRAGELDRTLDREPETLRSHRVLDFASFDVERIELARGDESLVIRRVAGEYDPARKWSLEAPPGFPLDPEQVDPWLDRLASASIVRFAGPEEAARAGQAPGEARLTLHLSGDEREALTLSIGGEADGGGRFAVRTGRPAPFVIDADTAAAIDPRQLAKAADGG